MFRFYSEVTMPFRSKYADPTPEEIRERSQEIQATWTPYERAVRSGKRPGHGYTIPEARVLGERVEHRQNFDKGH